MPEPALFGKDLFGENIRPPSRGPLADRFLFPPFTILDTRQGAWQERKRAWIAMGIKSEVGRGTSIVLNGTQRSQDGDGCWRRDFGRCFGQDLTKGENENFGSSCNTETSGASIFDPVLCECAYRWFCPRGGQVVDPFAGGSVRGIVAATLGLNYWGCDLRQEQIEANGEQVDGMMIDPRPDWVCGDAIDCLGNAPAADLVFSCPPYGNLEVYSDDPRDLSTMEWHTFVAQYKRIILRAAQKMKPNSFACFVVSNFRDKNGSYRNLVTETVAAFEAAGIDFYNDAILVNAVGSAAVRATKQFNSGRKLVKVHQNVLVFCKGDWKKASAAVSSSWVTEE